MKYVIVSKDIYAGTSQDDQKDPGQITEIATELVITRLYLLDLLSTGAVSKEDTVVCIEERKCLYTNIFKNIISYKEYVAMDKEESHTTLDLLTPFMFERLAGGDVNSRLIPYKPFYQNWERDKEEILNVKWSSLEGYDTSKPFVGLVVRKRGAWTEKNMSDEFWIDIIKKLEENNIKTFVFGKETEKFCTTDNTTYVKNYQDWCTLISNKNCLHVASTMTGGVFPLLVFGNSECKMSIIDNTQLMSIHAGDPSFYDSCINFSKIDITFINKIPTTDEFYDTITANL